jgi:E1-E2 ATPase
VEGKQSDLRQRDSFENNFLEVASPATVMMSSLSQAQTDLLNQLGSNLEQGFTTDEATAKREVDGVFNVVDPPIKCPPAICCLLPCIKHVASMKAFRALQPDDAEVKRNGKWVRYDASSLVKGDIIRIDEGDIVPADCVVLELESEEQLLVDHRNVTGEGKPRSCARSMENKTPPTQLFWGAHVAQGRAICVVTAIGSNTLVASLIRDKRFPPTGNVLHSNEDEEENAGISLIQRDVL